MGKCHTGTLHISDVTMSVPNHQQLNSLLNHFLGWRQAKHQISHHWPFVSRIHWWLVDFSHKGPVMSSWYPTCTHSVMLHFVVVWFWLVLIISFRIISLAPGQPKGNFAQGTVLVQLCAVLRCIAVPLIGSSWFQQPSLHWRAAVWWRTAFWVPKPIYGTAATAVHIFEQIHQLVKQCSV